MDVSCAARCSDEEWWWPCERWSVPPGGYENSWERVGEGGQAAWGSLCEVCEEEEESRAGGPAGAMASGLGDLRSDVWVGRAVMGIVAGRAHSGSCESECECAPGLLTPKKSKRMAISSMKNMAKMVMRTMPSTQAYSVMGPVRHSLVRASWAGARSWGGVSGGVKDGG